jgi:hypothetical protein
LLEGKRGSASFSEEKEAKRLFLIWDWGVGAVCAQGPDSEIFWRRLRPDD